MENFLSSMRTRQKPNLNGDLGYRIMAAMKLGVDSCRRGRVEFYGARGEGFVFIRYHQVIIYANTAAKATAGFTSPHRGVERKCTGNGFFIMNVTTGAMKIRRVFPCIAGFALFI